MAHTKTPKTPVKIDDHPYEHGAIGAVVSVTSVGVAMGTALGLAAGPAGAIAGAVIGGGIAALAATETTEMLNKKGELAPDGKLAK